MAESEIILYRSRFTRKWKARPPPNRRNNNLSPAVGLLELSNALDFAANAWNAIPPPAVARAFMALGATGALIILAFAGFDWPRAWHNTTLLRQERARLLQLQQDEEAALSKGMSRSDVQTYLDLNQRELGNEIIDRLGMGLLLGFGALTVGIGTYLAIDGQNPVSFLASNVITGYVGNVPAAIYGLMNAAWCFYGWRRAQRHTYTAVQNIRKLPENGGNDDAAISIERHSRRVKIHASTNGISGIAGGAGSLMTASAYIVPVCVWGYIILLPCAISAFSVNIYWRLRVNYDRDIVEPTPVDHGKILRDATLARTRERLLKEYIKAAHKAKGSQIRHADPDQDAVKKFVSCWLSADLAYFTDESERLSKMMESSGSKDEKEEQQIGAHKSNVTGDLEIVQMKIEHWNTVLTNIRPVDEQDTEKKSTIEDMAEALYGIVTAMDLLPRLCVRLANNSETLETLPKETQSLWELKIDPASLQQCLEERRMSASLFVEMANETLAHYGVKQARSHIRYYCELCGCAFGQPALETKG